MTVSANTNGIPTLKYRIKSLLADMPEYMRVKARKEICNELGISDATFSRRINALTTDTLDFPGLHLIVVAHKLGVPVIDLVNDSLLNKI